MEALKIHYYAIGHSYLLHGPFAGWQTSGAWGMAATTPAQDYFHLLQDKMVGSGCTVEAVAENHSVYERICVPEATREDYESSPSYAHMRDQLRSFRPNVITVCIDGNCPARDERSMELFYTVLFDLIAAEKTPEAVVLCGYFLTWNAVKGAAAKAATERYGFLGVDLSEIHRVRGKENPYYAFEKYPDYKGEIEFRTHPGDLGHAYIAEQFFNVLKDHLPTVSAVGTPLKKDEAASKKEHTVGQWHFESLDEAADFECGGFNLRVENSMLCLSAAVDTGLSVSCRKLDLYSKELYLKAAVEGEASLLKVTVYGTEQKEFVLPLRHGMQEYRLPLNQQVHGISIAPDGLDCHIFIDDLIF